MTAGDILFIVSFIILPTAIIVSCIWALVLIRRGVLFANQPPRSASQARESGYGAGYIGDDDAIAMDLDMDTGVDTRAYADDAEPMAVEPYSPAPTPPSIAPAAAPAALAASAATRQPTRRAVAPPAAAAAAAPATSSPAREPSMPAPLLRSTSTAPDTAPPPPAVPDRTDFTDELPTLPPNAAAPAASVAPAPVPAPAPAPAPAPRVSDTPTWSDTGKISTMPSGAYAGESVAPLPAASDAAARPRRQPGSAGLRPRARRAAQDTDGDR